MTIHTKTANKPAGKVSNGPLTEEQQAALKAETMALKAERFRKLGERRVIKLLAAFDAVKVLGNRRAYVYTSEQAQKIFDAIETKVKEVNDSFSGEGSKFKL